MGGSGPSKRALASGGRRMRELCEGSGGRIGRMTCLIDLFGCSDGLGKLSGVREIS